MKLQTGSLAGFYSRNPEFDVTTFDFHNPAAVAALDLTDAGNSSELSVAATYQRLLKLAGDEDTATRLMSAGFHSAHAVASISERRFVQSTANGVFAGGEKAARAAYRRASSIKARARHLAAAVRDMTSPYSRAMLSHNVDDNAVRYFTSMPSYQTLFGGLDRCQCEHCRSLYSPAAYFLDIMRITDEYITAANPIPPELTLESRRPDLFTMWLDCRNTNEIIPYLQLVNEILEANIGGTNPAGAFATLALAPYPFNLPYSLPLNQIRVYLGYLKSTLAEIFGELLQASAFGTAQGGGNAASGSPAYIILAAGSGPAADAFQGMVVAITAGKGAGAKRTIIAWDPATARASVDSDWPANGIPDNTSQYTVTDHRDVAREYLKLSIEQFNIVTTPAPDDAGVRKYYGYPQGETMFLPLADGVGKLTFALGATTVTGTDGTTFGATVTVGDVIACAGQYRTVQSIQSATQLTVDADWTSAATAAAFKVAHWLDGTGQMKFTKGSNIALGNEATHFDTALSPGDQLQCLGEVRTVVAIGQPDPTTKEIPVEVAGPWGVTAPFSAYTINPVDALDIVATFCERTSLSRDQASELVNQSLSPAERTAGIADWFFINDTNEDLPALQILVDENDPFRVYDKIAGLSLKRLDRISRFVRLNNVLGWTAEELNWALVAVRPNPSDTAPLQTALLDAATVESLAGIARLKATLNLPVEVLCSFWYRLKTTGRGDGTYPADLFDEIFNRPALLDGQNPYDTTKPAIPFDPARSLDWTVQEGQPALPGATTSNATIRSRLLGSLLVNDNDLTLVANYRLALLKDTTGVLKLDLLNLTWLYRLTKQAAALHFTPDEFLRFLRLYYYVPVWTSCSGTTLVIPPQTTVLKPDPGVQPPAGGLDETIANMLRWQSAAAWLTASPFNVYDLQYILAGEQSKQCQCGFTQAGVGTFIRDLSALSVDLRLNWGSFETEDVDSGKSLKVFESLMERNYINKHGIVLNVNDFSYERLAFLFPIAALSFVTEDISETESTAAFDLLKTQTYQNKHYLVQESITNAWSVAKDFSQTWPLDFLFTGQIDPALAAQQRLEVQSVLLAAQSDVNNTSKVLVTARDAQEQQARAGLAQFLAVPTEMLMALLWFTEHIRTLDAYRGGLLSPLPADALPPENVYCLASVLARGTLWVSKLELTAVDVSAAGSRPEAFGIADTTKLTFAGLRTLSSFKALTRVFITRPGALAAYFANPANLDAAAQLAMLAEITAWDPTQIKFLAERFWPFGSTLANEGYQTVAGVDRLNRCFTLGASIGVDVYFLENLYHLGDVPLADSSGALIPAAWEAYVARARNTLDALRQKSGPDLFTEQFVDITGMLDTQKRNALLGYAIWNLNKDFEAIRTPSDLYQFLLIDVEMSSCATTSRIAQGIASVQLYMQRCRMNLEPYVSVADIPVVWWEWMSNYRVWEANRKIFLYPENYIEPSLRKDATPVFHKLSEKLLQSDVNNASVSAAFSEYFEELTKLAGLEHCGSYTYAKKNATTGEPTDVLVLIARTATEPYTFYYREVDRVSTCAAAATALDWGPWLKIDLTIKAKWVTPVFAYERIFIFWIEQEETRSSQISGSQSSAQAVTKATVKYSFPTGEGHWVQPQVLITNDAVWVNPDSGYPPSQNPAVAGRFQPQWLAWNQPYVLKVARGLAGQGLLTVSKNFNVAGGFNTDVERQIHSGDLIWCAGEVREVDAVFPNEQEIVMTENWSITAQKAPYKVIPRDTARTQFEPFTGPGTVNISKQIPEVTGVGTSFLSDISAGDQIQIAGQIYGVVSVDSDTSIFLDQNMPASASGLTYVVIPAADGNERLLVFFGSPLSISNGVDPGNRPASPVGVADAFQQSVLQFDNTVYDSLSMTSSGANQNIPGYATLSIATWLDPDLLSKTANLLVADYTWLPIQGQAPVPQPYQALVHSSLAMVKVVPAASVIADNAWTNRSGLTPPALEPNAAAAGLDLLYHISPETSSLLNVGNQVGWYVYNNGDEAFSFQTDETNVGKIADQTFVTAYPLAAEMVRGEPDVLSCGPYTDSATLFPNTKFTVNRLTTRAVAFLNQRLFAGGVSSLLTLDSQYTRELPFRRFYALPESGPPNGLNPAHLPPDLMDFEGSYGPYFWEVFFFGPSLVADSLTANQRFDEARTWYQYIFNPTQPPAPDEIKPSDRYWRFRPFRDMTLENIWSILTSCVQIERYNNDPFNPDAIARLRPTAYAKSVVLRYIDNLLKWADSLFSQDTRESINIATQLYVTASDLLGPRPASLGKCVPSAPANFNEIKAHYPDGIPQFLIDLENTPAMLPEGCCTLLDDPGLDIHSYFCIPENDDLTRYWDLVEDRLFKIRHCMNIKGMERQLALFSPPINPRDLIRTSTAGQSGGAPVTGSAQAPIPFYRFSATLQTAQSFAAAVTGLGASLLSALEKNDAEQLAVLRNTQELALLNLTTQIKQQQIEQTVQIGQSLEISRQTAAYRKDFYNGLIAAGLLPSESLNIASMIVANYLTLMGSIMKTMSGVGHLVPNVGSPFAMTYGGVQIGSSLNAVGSYFEAAAGVANFIASLSLTLAGYERREQDWKLQAQLGDYDQQQAAAQILANNTQRLMAERELELHYETIRQTQEVDNFYRTKFTSQELYQWMIGRISAVYFQAYSLAYDMARSAQRAYQYEIATDQEFVNFGYWDSLKKGLLAGEGLQLALSQMEKSYFDRNTRALEIEKTISLMQVNPAALIDLKNKGECMFELTEELFDLDYPGQYLRKIKTVSISIPAIVGPYQNIKATLTQMSNQLVLTPDINAVKFLLGTGAATPPVSLRSNVWTNQQIAISRGVNDSGMFELNYGDARYLPFEGTGAVSGWKLSMPLATNRLNFAAITDVVLTLKYTAFNGGDDFRKKVRENLTKYTGGILLSLAQTYSQPWYAFMQNHSDPASQTLEFELPPSFVPSFLKAPKLTGIFTQLEVRSGVSANQTQPYIDFYPDDKQTKIPLPVRSGNSGFTDPFTPILLTNMVGARRLVFRLGVGETPLSLLSNGFLDPAVLRNIGLILYIEGDINWS